MIFIGADLSVRRSAFVLLNDGGVHLSTLLFGTGVGKETKKLNSVDFLCAFHNFVSSILVTYKVLGDKSGDDLVIAVEDYAFTQSENKGSHRLHEVGGVFRLAVGENISAVSGFITVPQGSLKRFVTGKGNSPKLEVFKQVLLEWDNTIKTDDEADAYGLAKLARLVWRVHKGIDDDNSKLRRDCAAKLIEDGRVLFWGD